MKSTYLPYCDRTPYTTATFSRQTLNYSKWQSMSSFCNILYTRFHCNIIKYNAIERETQETTLASFIEFISFPIISGICNHLSPRFVCIFSLRVWAMGNVELILRLFICAFEKKPSELLTECDLTGLGEISNILLHKKKKGWIGIFTNACNPNLAA